MAVAVDGRIHVIGVRFSVGDEDMTDLHEIYDAATDSWSVAAPMPTPRGGISGAFHQGMIFILGAEDGMQDFTMSLTQLVQTDLIDRQTAFEVAPNVDMLKMALKGINVSSPGIL